MTDEEKREKQKQYYEEQADPKWNMNHVACSCCGHRIYAPHPGEAREHEWGQMTFLPLLVAYLISKDWNITKDEGACVCPQCSQTGLMKSKQMRRPISSAVRSLPHYEQWILKMRNKFNYYKEEK